MPLINSTREARDLVKSTIESNMTTLGLGYVGVDDEQRLPKYPAVVVSAGPKNKGLHGTATFGVELRTLIWVYHANMSASYRTRSNEDLVLVESIEALLEFDMTFGDQVIQAWVENEQPGVFQPRSNKGSMVVGTRMTWYALTQERFGS